MSARKNPSITTLKALFSKSGNQCSFPSCSNKLFTDDNIFVGQVCHIEAYSKEGLRFNSATSLEEKNEYGNLVLMCYEHHRIIDSHPTYTTEIIKSYKEEHEKQFSNTEFSLNEMQAEKVISQIEGYWDYLNCKHSDNDPFRFEFESKDSLFELTEKIRKSVDIVFSSYASLVKSDLDPHIYDWVMAAIGTHNHSVAIEICLLQIEINFLVEKLKQIENENDRKSLDNKRIELDILLANERVFD